MPAYYYGTPTFSPLVSDDYRIAALQSRPPNVMHQIWQNRDITYSFIDLDSRFSSNYGIGELNGYPTPLNSEQREAVRQALTAWSNVANITFTEVADGIDTVGDLRFGFTSAMPAQESAHAYMPSIVPQGGDIWINATRAEQDFSTGTSISPLSPEPFVRQSAYNYLVVLHEIGHALGLSHPFQTDTPRSTQALPMAEDNYSNTVMSYREASAYGGIPTTPMRYDVAAIQYLYGANTSHNAGDDTYRYDIDDINYSTLWDGGGADTLVVTNDRNITREFVPYKTAIVDLRDGKQFVGVGFSSEANAQYLIGEEPYKYAPYRGTGRVMIADGVVIENIRTTGLDDLIYGNAANNVIDSGDGSDSINGGAGMDTSVYSRAKSTYVLRVSDNWLNFDGTGTRTTMRSVTDTFVTPGMPGYKEDWLISVERLQFADVSVAFDLDGNAGITAKILGAVFGPAAIGNRNYAGIGLELLDKGMSYLELMQIALNAKLGAVPSDTAVVNLLYTNLIGTPPHAAALNYYKGLLDTGYFSQLHLAMYVAELPQNAASINLVGLATTGIEYS